MSGLKIQLGSVTTKGLIPEMEEMRGSKSDNDSVVGLLLWREVEYSIPVRLQGLLI